MSVATSRTPASMTRPRTPRATQALGEQVAEVAVLARAGRRHDQDVAGLALLDGDVDHPVVAGRHLAGERVAGDARAGGRSGAAGGAAGRCGPAPRAPWRRPAAPSASTTARSVRGVLRTTTATVASLVRARVRPPWSDHAMRRPRPIRFVSVRRKSGGGGAWPRHGRAAPASPSRVLALLGGVRRAPPSAHPDRARRGTPTSRCRPPTGCWASSQAWDARRARRRRAATASAAGSGSSARSRRSQRELREVVAAGDAGPLRGDARERPARGAARARRRSTSSASTASPRSPC